MKIDFEDAKFLMKAAIDARGWWYIPSDVRIVQVGRADKLTVPICGFKAEWYEEDAPLPDPIIDRPTFGQEVITLDKYVDSEGRVIRMGYGPRSNTLAVRID